MRELASEGLLTLTKVHHKDNSWKFKIQNSKFRVFKLLLFLN